MRLRNRGPTEASIEARFVKYARGKGCKAFKFTSPAHRSVPDRLVVCPWGRAFFIEFKRPGEKPTPAQRMAHADLRERGHTVYVCNNFGQAESALDEELRKAERFWNLTLHAHAK